MPPKRGHKQTPSQPLRVVATGQLADIMRKMIRSPTTDSDSSTSPTQTKVARVDDGMEQGLQAGTSQTTMQISAAENTSITAVAADEGIDQPDWQTNELAVVPFSSEESAPEVPETQARDQIIASLEGHFQHLMQQFQAIQQTIQQIQALQQIVQQLRAPGPSHAECAQPMQPPMQSPLPETPTASQTPEQTPPQQPPPAQPTTQPSKQPPKQQGKQPTTQLQYAKVVAQTCSAMTKAAVQAILPAPKQTQPLWQQQSHQRKAQRSQQNQKQHQQRSAIGVDKFAYRCHFTVSGPNLDTAGTATQVAKRVIDRVEGGDGVVVVDAVRLGPAASPRIQFKVATVEQAEILIRGRGKALAGSGVVLSEVLSAAEAARHKQLYPEFLRLGTAGHKVQFRRARLFVDGQLWSPTGSSAAA